MYIPSLTLASLCLISRRLLEILWCLLAYVVFVPQGGKEEADYIHQDPHLAVPSRSWHL